MESRRNPKATPRSHRPIRPQHPAHDGPGDETSHARVVSTGHIQNAGADRESLLSHTYQVIAPDRTTVSAQEDALLSASITLAPNGAVLEPTGIRGIVIVATDGPFAKLDGVRIGKVQAQVHSKKAE